jgi:hypothetical protein
MSANREVLVENRSPFSDIIEIDRESRAPWEASTADQVNEVYVICIEQAEDARSGEADECHSSLPRCQEVWADPGRS